MQDSTRKIIETAAMADGSVAIEALKAAIDILTGERPTSLVQQKPLDSVMSREEVGKVLNLSPHRVDHYSRIGVLQRVVMPGCRWATGISRSSVEKALETALSSRGTD